jgi:hypothetical protein
MPSTAIDANNKLLAELPAELQFARSADHAGSISMRLCNIVYDGRQYVWEYHTQHKVNSNGHLSCTVITNGIQIACIHSGVELPPTKFLGAKRRTIAMLTRTCLMMLMTP